MHFQALNVVYSFFSCTFSLSSYDSVRFFSFFMVHVLLFSFSCFAVLPLTFYPSKLLHIEKLRQNVSHRILLLECDAMSSQKKTRHKFQFSLSICVPSRWLQAKKETKKNEMNWWRRKKSERAAGRRHLHMNTCIKYAIFHIVHLCCLIFIHVICLWMRAKEK